MTQENDKRQMSENSCLWLLQHSWHAMGDIKKETPMPLITCLYAKKDNNSNSRTPMRMRKGWQFMTREAKGRYNQNHESIPPPGGERTHWITRLLNDKGAIER